MRHRRDHHSLDEFCHRGNGVFNRNRRIGTVEVEEVDAIDPQPRQRLVESFVDVGRVGPYRPIAPYTRSTTKLGGKEDLVALPGLLEP